MCVASQYSQNKRSYFVVRDGRHYVFPDSVLHGKLEWNRSDAKRLAVKILEHLTHGVFTGDAYDVEKIFGLKETHRAVGVSVDLETLFPVLQRVQKHLGKVDARLVTLEDINVLSIESAHVLRHFESKL